MGKNPTSSATGSFLKLDSSTRIISLYGPLPQAQTCRLIALCPSITSGVGAVGQAKIFKNQVLVRYIPK